MDARWTPVAETLLVWLSVFVLAVYCLRVALMFLHHGFQKPARSVHTLALVYMVLSAYLIGRGLCHIGRYGQVFSDRFSDFSYVDSSPSFKVFTALTGLLVGAAFLCNCARALSNLTALDLGRFDPLDTTSLGKYRVRKGAECLLRLLSAYLFVFLEQTLHQNESSKESSPQAILWPFGLPERFCDFLGGLGQSEGHQLVVDQNTAGFTNQAGAGILLYLALSFWFLVVFVFLKKNKWRLGGVFGCGFLVAVYLAFLGGLSVNDKSWIPWLLFFLFPTVCAALGMIILVSIDLKQAVCDVKKLGAELWGFLYSSAPLPAQPAAT